MRCISVLAVASEIEVQVRVAMMRHPELKSDPFALATVTGLQPDQVQGVLLRQASEEEILEWEEEKRQRVRDTHRLYGDGSDWFDRYWLEGILNDGNQ